MLIRSRSNLVSPAILVISSIISVWPAMALAGNLLTLPDGSKLDLSQKCPVCGMIIGGKEGQAVTLTFNDGRVATFGGVAAAVFNDGHTVGFEGARCLFIYNSVPQKYRVSVKDVTRQFVTDYRSKKLIDLTGAYLVLGSDVKGPMGYDLIPFASKEDAGKFAAANNGKWIVQLHEVPLVPQKTHVAPKGDESDRRVPATGSVTDGGGSVPTLGQALPQGEVSNQESKISGPQKRETPRNPGTRGHGEHHGGMMPR